MRFFAKPGLFVATALMLLAVTPARSAPACPDTVPLPLVADGIPLDDELCPDGVRGLKGFAHMTWQTFKMLVWPASMAAGSRGEPDKAREITAMSGPRVFETYKSDWEILPVRAAKQQDWGTYPSEAAVCKGYTPAKPGRLPDGSLVLASSHKFASVTQPDTPGAPLGVGNLLIGQNGSAVRYLAAFNENAFNLIKNLDQSVNFDPSEGDPIEGKTKAADGTITIKSAWIEIKDSKPDPSRIYHRSAWVQDPSTGECREATVGLVGLHIVHKTQSSQQWIWASFEHVQNAPLRGQPPSGFTFNDGSGAAMPTSPPANTEITKPPTGPWVAPPPYNVERLNEIAPDIQTVNGIWRRAFQGSVWSNYQLVVVQWPGLAQAGTPPKTLFGDHGVSPAPPCGVAYPRANMANTVMETFLQPTDALACPMDELKLVNTCMGCHYQTHNYDFIWAIPLNNNASPDAGVASRIRRSALSTLRKITGGSPR
jgi:hypothetical protein